MLNEAMKIERSHVLQADPYERSERRRGQANGFTQTRTFTWSGTDLASETTPEAGTVQYQYDGAHHVTLRTDAAGQQTQYSYDAYGRLTQVSHWTWVSPTVIATCRNR
jgi:YD repeat-containing protein